MLSILLVMFLLSCEKDQTQQVEGDAVFQLSTITALLEGEYDGLESFENLQAKGDFGLGTFEAVDGELIMLDGVIYQVREDGIATIAIPGDKSPFVTLKHFEADEKIDLNPGLTIAEIGDYIDTSLETEDHIYAVSISGVFDSLTLRSVPRQSEPYPPLAEVVAQQIIFNHQNIEGTLVGFRYPSYADDINVAGYHFHFISTDRTIGGHVLDGILKEGTAQIDQASDLILKLK